MKTETFKFNLVFFSVHSLQKHKHAQKRMKLLNIKK